MAHLVTRFFASLRARPLDAATVAWVSEVLEPAELGVFDDMNRADRAEAVDVARRTEAALTDLVEAAEPRWLAAALLHDAGKQCSGYGTVGRAAVTAIGVAVGEGRVREWVTSAKPARARMGRYLAHDDLGADLLRERGARPEVAAWAGAHHRSASWAASGIPPEVCRALATADGEPIDHR